MTGSLKNAITLSGTQCSATIHFWNVRILKRRLEDFLVAQILMVLIVLHNAWCWNTSFNLIHMWVTLWEVWSVLLYCLSFERSGIETLANRHIWANLKPVAMVILVTWKCAIDIFLVRQKAQSMRDFQLKLGDELQTTLKSNFLKNFWRQWWNSCRKKLYWSS